VGRGPFFGCGLKSAPGAFSSFPSLSLFLFLVLFENYANETLFDSNKF
jgi:hypothetical protein